MSPRPELQALSALAARFPTASAELLERRSLQRRVDTKFITRVADVTSLLKGLEEHYALVLANGEALATYRTLYFDTPDFQCFHNHRRGRRARHKVRIRHYNDRSVSYLEVKTKRSVALTYKKRRSVPFGDSELTGEGRDFVTSACSIDANALSPQSWTNFRRLTLVSLESPERVTIDVGLELSHGDKIERLDDVAIVEIKQSPYSIRTPIMRALRAHRLRPASMSKYMTSLALTRDGLRINQLRPVLRHLQRLTS